MQLQTFVESLVLTLPIQSLLCYGSYVMELSLPHQSDIDLLALVQGDIPKSDVRRKAYETMERVAIIQIADDTPKTSMWDNSWSPVNDRLLIDSQLVEIGYNTTKWVHKVLDMLLKKHLTTFAAFPFRPYTFLGLLETSQLLYDQDHFVAGCKERMRPFPKPLKKAICSEFLPIFKENVKDLIDCGNRDVGILSYLFFLERSIDALIQLLFAINEIYDPASKRTEYYLARLKQVPNDLDSFLYKLLPHFYENRENIALFFSNAIQWIEIQKI